MSNLSDKKLFFISVISASAGLVSADLYLPSLIAISRDFHTSINLVQFSIAIFIIGFGISRLFSGLVSDAIGRKKPLISVIIICLIGTLICLFSTNIFILLVGRFIQGLGAGGCSILGRIILRDRFVGKELAKFSSYFSMIGITAIAAAPFLGGYFQYYLGWRFSFLFLVFYLLFLVFVAVFLMKETNRHSNFENLKLSFLKKNFNTLFGNRIFLICATILFFSYGFVMYSWLTEGPILLENFLNITPIEFGWCSAIVGFCYFLGAFLNSKIVNKNGMERMVFFGASLILISSLFMIFSVIINYINIFSIIIPVMIGIFGLSFINANVFALGMTPFQKISGFATAVLGSIQVLGSIFVISTISILPNINQLPIAISFLISGCMIIIFIKKIKKET